jgi:hypothetical protein
MNTAPGVMLALLLACGCGQEKPNVKNANSRPARVVIRPANERDRLFQVILTDVDRWEAVYHQQPKNAVALKRQASGVQDKVRELFPAPRAAAPESTKTPPEEGAATDEERAKRVLDTHHKYVGPGAASPYEMVRLAPLARHAEERAVQDLKKSLNALAAHWAEDAPSAQEEEVRRDFKELRKKLNALSARPGKKVEGKDRPASGPPPDAKKN